MKKILLSLSIFLAALVSFTGCMLNEENTERVWMSKGLSVETTSGYVPIQVTLVLDPSTHTFVVTSQSKECRPVTLEKPEPYIEKGTYEIQDNGQYFFVVNNSNHFRQGLLKPHKTESDKYFTIPQIFFYSFSAEEGHPQVEKWMSNVDLYFVR